MRNALWVHGENASLPGVVRAGAAYHWRQQADGIYLFNLFCLPEQNPDTRVWIRLNHHLLEKIVQEVPWYRVQVPPGILRKGYNELCLWCNQEVTQVEKPAIIHYVFLRVEY